MSKKHYILETAAKCWNNKLNILSRALIRIMENTLETIHQEERNRIINKYYEEKIKETKKRIELLTKQNTEEDLKIALYKHKAGDLGIDLPDDADVSNKSLKD